MITHLQIEEKREMRQELNTRMLHNVQENVDFKEITLLETAHLGDMYIAAFEAMNDKGEKTKFHMAYSSDHDMMLPYGDVFSEDIPVIPELDLATVIE